MKVYLVKQYSPDWWALRAGVPTASDFDRIFTGEGKESKQQAGYLTELMNHRINPEGNAFTESGKRIGTPAMEEGRATEPEARDFYAMTRGKSVKEVGFVVSDCRRFGCSPDGLVGTRLVTRGREPSRVDQHKQIQWVECAAEGGLELKCPQPHTQQKYLAKPDQLPNRYRPQVHGQLLVTGAPWWDFLSYVKDDTPLLVRVVPDDYTRALADALERFLQVYQDAWDDFLLLQSGQTVNVG